MLHAITVPKWGLSMERAAVRAWLVTEGSRVEAGAGIVELESEKIANELQAETTGVLRRILAPEGTQARVGDPLAIIATAAESDEEVDAYAQQLAASVATVQADGEGEAKLRHERVGSWDIAYVCAGTDRPGRLPALLIHGFGGDLTTWQFNAAALGSARKIVALDLPGHGASSREVGTGSVDQLAEAVEGLLAALSMPRAHLVAHSLGAAVAARVARRLPEKTASLTLLSPAGAGARVDDGFIQAFSQAGSRKEVQRALAWLFEDRSLVTPELVEKVQQARRIDGARQALQKIASANFGPGGVCNAGNLEGLGNGTLIVWGDRDRVIAFEQWERPRVAARFEKLASVGHMPQIEAAGAINELLMSHFSAHDA
jgi:pyruvate dehydrogenase E2 component (dihydrolipoamide acetyltransferase)